MTMNSCIDCKHAEWAKTSNGRVNPHKHGQCTWAKVVYVPLSLSKNTVALGGGVIWRKKPYEKCPTFSDRCITHIRV